MLNLPSVPDFVLDVRLAKVTSNNLMTDIQVDELVAICDPPAEQLRDSIAIEFERAALVLFWDRAVFENRAKRRAAQAELHEAQRYAKKLSYIIANMDPEFKSGLNSNFKEVQKHCDYSAALPDVEHLLNAFADLTPLYPPVTKSQDVVVWVIDSLTHAFETRLSPALSFYGPCKKGNWFSNARQAKLIFAFLRTVEPEKVNRYNLEYISHRVKCSKQLRAARMN